MRQKQKVLIMSNFSFCYKVFNSVLIFLPKLSDAGLLYVVNGKQLLGRLPKINGKETDIIRHYLSSACVCLSVTDHLLKYWKGDKCGLS